MYNLVPHIAQKGEAGSETASDCIF